MRTALAWAYLLYVAIGGAVVVLVVLPLALFGLPLFAAGKWAVDCANGLARSADRQVGKPGFIR